MKLWKPGYGSVGWGGVTFCNYKWSDNWGILEKVLFEHELGDEELCQADIGRIIYAEEIIRAKFLGKKCTQSGSKEVCAAEIKGESSWR